MVMWDSLTQRGAVTAEDHTAQRGQRGLASVSTCQVQKEAPQTPQGWAPAGSKRPSTASVLLGVTCTVTELSRLVDV